MYMCVKYHFLGWKYIKPHTPRGSTTPPKVVGQNLLVNELI